MGYPVDGWTEGPGLPQSVWRYKWLVGGLVLLGILGASLWSASQPTQYEGVVRIFVSADDTSGDPERTVMSHAQFIESQTVSDRVITLTGNRLTRNDLENQLTVEPSADADVITIRALDTTPGNAAALAEAVDLAYRQVLSEQRQAAANQAIAALEDEQKRLASEVEQIQKKRRTGDTAALNAEEQAKRRQMEATANKIEEISADAAGPPPALQDKAAVPDEPAQPKPLRDGAIGAVVGLVIGGALAWWLAARRRVKPSEDSAESQAHDDDLEVATEVVDDLVEHPLTHEPVSHAASHVGRFASDVQESPEQVPRLADVDHNGVTGSVRLTANTLGKDNDLLSSLADWLETQHQNFPQITAERLKDRLPFEWVALLLKTDEGLDLAGCVGWHPDGAGPVERYDLSILTKLGANGARLIESADRRELVNAGLLGNEAQTIVVAPLEHENVAFGVLLVGHEEPESGASPKVNGSFEGIVSFARSVAPDLHAWLLLHRLREQLASRGKAQDADPEPAPEAAIPNTTDVAREHLRQQPHKQTRSQRKR